MEKYSYFDFTPMIIASIYGSRAGGDLKAWKVAFMLGIGLALFQFFLYKILKREIDPFAIGLNLFLLIGALGYNLMIPPVLTVFGQLREAASFVFLAVVGILFLLLKKEGLLDRTSPRTKLYSFLIVLLIFVCGSVSYQFKGDQLFSITLPFMALFFVRNLLNKRILTQVADVSKDQAPS